MDLGDVVLLLIAIILLPFAIGAGLKVLALIAIPILELIESLLNRWNRRKLKRDDKKAEELGLTVWQYRRKKRDGEL